MTMNTSLIIDAGQQLRWHQRLFFGTSTAMMWGGWLLLWRPVLLISWLMSVHHPSTLWHMLGMIELEQYISVLLSATVALLLWTTLPSQQIRNPRTRQLDDYAQHFNVSTEQILQRRSQNICTVHYDEHGNITKID
ncbi:MAG: poly-beta-1,6-N-acetyl-D-glucosamine biosynthesis protein PgaD [Moraxellaceae bacterium]|nr:MAG: poly-beta-1,6-N-acetyl-D-glucosamine biosynthesis protein PgaD [Moraxellaceae bacterium]